MTTIAETVTQYRKAAAAMRRVSCRSDWTRHGSSRAAMGRHRATLDRLDRVLITELGVPALAGFLAHESDLTARIAVRRHDQVPYPDLSQRLARLRAEIRTFR